MNVPLCSLEMKRKEMMERNDASDIPPCHWKLHSKLQLFTADGATEELPSSRCARKRLRLAELFIAKLGADVQQYEEADGGHWRSGRQRGGRRLCAHAARVPQGPAREGQGEGKTAVRSHANLLNETPKFS